MGSVEVSNFMVNGDLAHEGIGPKDTTVSRLHDIVHRLEEENDFLLPLRQNDKMSSEYSTSNGFVPYNKEEEESTDTYTLENIPPLDDREFDEVDYEKDDSWLYSPSKESSHPGTPAKNPETWLKENAITPELLRVRSSLSEKLEVIAIENRKGRYDRLRKTKDDFRKGSTLSLDWDFEDDELSSIGGGGSLGANIDDFGSNPDISYDWESDLGTVQPRGIQAWAENSMPPRDELKTFTLDWSDDEEEEDELSPMHINLNQSQCQPRKSPGNNMVFKRGTQGSNVAAVRPRTSNNNEQNEFTAKPTGGVKPRRSAPQRDMDFQYEEEQAHSSSSSPSYEYEDSAPVVARGRKKDVRAISPPSGYDESVSAPVILRGTAKRGGHSADAVSPRSQANIVKPVQRRKPLESSDSDYQVRPRGSGGNTNQVRPRGSANKQSPNNSDVSESSLKVSLSSMGDGAAVRRRGPVQTAEVAPMPRRSVDPTPRRAADPSPRRNKDPLASVRQQEVAPARRSTGSVAQPRSNDNVARPRRSYSPTARPRGASPTGVARPRGAPPI